MGEWNGALAMPRTRRHHFRHRSEDAIANGSRLEERQYLSVARQFCWRGSVLAARQGACEGVISAYYRPDAVTVGVRASGTVVGEQRSFNKEMRLPWPVSQRWLGVQKKQRKAINQPTFVAFARGPVYGRDYREGLLPSSCWL